MCQSSSPQQIRSGLSRLQLLAKKLNPELNDTRGTICRAKEPGITMVATTVAPCGHCRQFLNELRGAPYVCCVLVAQKASPTKKNASLPYSAAFQLAELLPESFGPLDLHLHDDSELLLEPRNNHIRLSSEALNAYSEEIIKIMRCTD